MLFWRSPTMPVLRVQKSPSRHLARKLPSLISKHERLITPEREGLEATESLASSSSIPLDPTLTLLPLAVSHLSPPSPLPVLPSAHAATPDALLRILRRARHHPRLAALDLHLLLAAASDSSAFRPDHRLTSLIAARLAYSRRLPSLRRLLDLILSRPCPCTDDSIFACPELLPTFRKAILAFAASGDIPATYDALASLRRAADSPLPTEFYNIILHALARLRRHEDAIRFYGEMISTHCVPPDVYTFNILINSSCRAEGVDAAIRWFQEMRCSSCPHTSVSFNTLMRGFFREGRYKEGIKVAREMFQLGFGLSVASMEILIRGLCHGGEASQSAEVFIEFLVDGVMPEGFDCLNLVESLCHIRKVEKAVWEDSECKQAEAASKRERSLRSETIHHCAKLTLRMEVSRRVKTEGAAWIHPGDMPQPTAEPELLVASGHCPASCGRTRLKLPVRSCDRHRNTVSVLLERRLPLWGSAIGFGLW
ncbi:hypothetical protein GUJ93_ZPchr0007g4435 [Zizania palustris]|uniref:Pentatricopeptide repeat-containing protein n=1 Tax=Zizania palustris TaxID=103762 RepID=A0A8J5W4K6_ZIZPA|nr:hypothetical protein GUJ93_ZPchr0007g4435 [Zizania palustris]